MLAATPTVALPSKNFPLELSHSTYLFLERGPALLIYSGIDTAVHNLSYLSTGSNHILRFAPGLGQSRLLTALQMC